MKILVISGGINVAKYFQKVFQVSQKLKIKNIKFRFHPSDSKDTKAKTDFLIGKIDFSENLFSAIKKSNFVISQFSTSIFETLKQKKPCVVFNAEKQCFSDVFQNTNLLYLCTDLKKLENVIKKFKNNQKLMFSKKKNKQNAKFQFFSPFNKNSLNKSLKLLNIK